MKKAITFATVGTFAVCVASIGLFAFSEEPPKVIELPPLSKIQIQSTGKSEAIQKTIRGALSDGANHETGDPVLDDVLRLIQQRGSILDGSALDEIEPKPQKPISQRARAAESLLKAARQLEKLSDSDNTQGELVSQMRREAVRLLTD